MKKKLTALLCTLCMAVALCATAFAKAATPTMTATATLSEDKKQVKVVLSLSGMDGNYTGMGSDLVYDQSQITYVRLNEQSVLVRKESAVRQWTDFLHDGAVTILGAVQWDH